MSQLNSEKSINEAIHLLEEKQAIEGELLKEEFYSLSERMKPINLIKSTFNEAMESTEVKTNLFNTTVDIATNYLSGMLHKSSKSSTTKKVIGSVLIHGVSNLYLKNPKTYRVIEGLVQEFFQKTPSNSSHERGEITHS